MEAHQRAVSRPSVSGKRSSTPLRLVDPAPLLREEVRLWSQEKGSRAHPLHSLLTAVDGFNPEVAAFALKRFSKRGDTVLDPFCGFGTAPLEAALRGRIPFASDLDPLALRVTGAKLQPADLAEVTLALGAVHGTRPVDLTVYHALFEAFYDTQTFREIVNLKNAIPRLKERVGRFVELVALSLLHGSSAGYFSTYSVAHVALSPDQQAALNDRRGQYPDYRAVMPRVLRRAAMALREGIPSVLTHGGRSGTVTKSDARDLGWLASSSVDLVLTGPPLPDSGPGPTDLWLEQWFTEISPEARAPGMWNGSDTGEWLVFMNEVLLELARVTKPCGRAVLALDDPAGDAQLESGLIDMVESELGKFWNAERLVAHTEKQVTVARRSAPSCVPGRRLLVLRRR